MARIAKIYPTHILTFLIVAAFLPSTSEFNTKFLIKALLNVSLLQSFIPIKDVYFSFNGPSWSLSCEMFFYFILPPLLKYRRRFGINALLLVWGFFSLATTVSMNYADGALNHFIYYINPVTRFLDFGFGVILHNLWQRIKTYNTHHLTIIEIASVIFFIIFFSLHNQIRITYRYSLYYWIPISLIILSFAYSRGYLSLILNKQPFVKLGEISFGFYMIHQPIIRFATLLKYPPSTTLIITTIASLAISWLFYHYFEKPVAKIIKTKFQKGIAA